MFKQVLRGMVEANGSSPRHGADFASVFGPRSPCAGFRAGAVLASVFGLGCFWARFRAEAVIHHFYVRGQPQLSLPWSRLCVGFWAEES